jgi:AcrR family transcriptional regulator
MREDIMIACLRVLQCDGPLRFTTTRVAEAAGISVGSLYQYYPNKGALLFALHRRTVDEAWVAVQEILDHPTRSPRDKIRDVAALFFVAESQDVQQMGALLHEAEVHLSGHPEYRALRAEVAGRFAHFVRASLPARSSAERIEFGTLVLLTVIESVGRAVAEASLPPAIVRRRAKRCADMIADMLGLA